ITDQQPVVAQNAVAMGPTVRQVQAGVMLEALPTLEQGRDGVIVDIKTRVAEWNEPGRVELPLATSTTQPGNRAIAAMQSSAVIDRLNMVTQELKTVARLPLGKPALLGGMTLDPTISEPQNPQLYLILRIDAGRLKSSNN